MASSYNRLVSPIYQGNNVNSPFNPEKFGPGVWTMFHGHAFEKSPFFPEMVKATAKMFWCPEKCKPHFIQYLKNYPIPQSPSKWFDWTVDFHNDVNERIGKPIVSRQQAYEMYANPESCASCSRDTTPQRQVTNDLSRQSFAVDTIGQTGYAMPNSQSNNYRTLRR